MLVKEELNQLGCLTTQPLLQFILPISSLFGNDSKRAQRLWNWVIAAFILSGRSPSEKVLQETKDEAFINIKPLNTQTGIRMLTKVS